MGSNKKTKFYPRDNCGKSIDSFQELIELAKKESKVVVKRQGSRSKEYMSLRIVSEQIRASGQRLNFELSLSTGMWVTEQSFKDHKFWEVRDQSLLEGVDF